MRISTAQFYESSATSYSKNFSGMNKTNDQVTSGIRIQTAADDPVGAARLLLLQQQQALLDQYGEQCPAAGGERALHRQRRHAARQ